MAEEKDATLPDELAPLLHTPTEASRAHVEWAKQMKDAPGVTWGIPAMDDELIPMHPGDMTVVVGRPTHCKSSILAYLSATEAERIKARGAMDTECVVHVSWEQVMEEIDSMFHVTKTYTVTDIVRGRVPIDEVETSAAKRIGLPVWLVGQSITKGTRTSTSRLTMEAVWRIVEHIKHEFKKKVTLLCGDYLQLVPVARARDLVSEVTHAADLMKELGMRCGCPVVLAVQARQEVDDYKLPIPGTRDGQWSSRIYQTCDKWFSLWRPWNTHQDQETISIGGKPVQMHENLLVISKLKERFNTSRRTWSMHFDPRYLRLGELESDAKEPTYDF